MKKALGLGLEVWQGCFYFRAGGIWEQDTGGGVKVDGLVGASEVVWVEGVAWGFGVVDLVSDGHGESTSSARVTNYGPSGDDTRDLKRNQARGKKTCWE